MSDAAHLHETSVRRRHCVLTGVALALPVTAREVGRTMIAMKRLSDEEIDYYAAM
jgi:predicted house-cleaning NTP pyrophosphatase (Maf/HAM1 superfamily)